MLSAILNKAFTQPTSMRSLSKVRRFVDNTRTEVCLRRACSAMSICSLRLENGPRRRDPQNPWLEGNWSVGARARGPHHPTKRVRGTFVRSSPAERHVRSSLCVVRAGIYRFDSPFKDLGACHDRVCDRDGECRAWVGEICCLILCLHWSKGTPGKADLVCRLAIYFRVDPALTGKKSSRGDTKPECPLSASGSAFGTRPCSHTRLCRVEIDDRVRPGQRRAAMSRLIETSFEGKAIPGGLAAHFRTSLFQFSYSDHTPRSGEITFCAWRCRTFGAIRRYCRFRNLFSLPSLSTVPFDCWRYGLASGLNVGLVTRSLTAALYRQQRYYYIHVA